MGAFILPASHFLHGIAGAHASLASFHVFNLFLKQFAARCRYSSACVIISLEKIYIDTRCRNRTAFLCKVCLLNRKIPALLIVFISTNLVTGSLLLLPLISANLLSPLVNFLLILWKVMLRYVLCAAENFIVHSWLVNNS